MQPKSIPSRDLRASVLPQSFDEWVSERSPRAVQENWADARHLREFATTFDGDAFLGKSLAKFWIGVAQVYEQNAQVVSWLSIAGLRACLYAEYQAELQIVAAKVPHPISYERC